jgi:TRAP-type C4-dicarboxylate transport system permease small subunit
MQAGINLFYRVLEGLIVIALAGMVVMVFGNVVLRYGFNGGIAISEELSRFFFVWLSFIGAVIAFREYSHLGIETFVQKLSRKGRLVCMGLSNAIVAVCSFIFFWGTWQQLEINITMAAPVSGLSMGWVYGVGLFTGGGICVIALERVVRVIAGRTTEEEISAFCGEGEAAAMMREGTQ